MLRLLRPSLFVLCAVALGTPTVTATPLTPGSPIAVPQQETKALPTLEVAGHDFHRRLLANGLHAVAVQDEGDQVSIFMVVATGKRMETAATTGLAHLTEHALYAGTPTTPANEHDRYIKALDGESNAYTRDDVTVYYDHLIPARNLEEVLRMEADRLVNLDLKPAPVLHERERLRVEERDSFQDADARAEALEAAVFQVHPYRFGVLDEKHHTQGPKLSVEQIGAFYRQWYHPRNTAVIVVGPGDPEANLDRIEQAFGNLAAGPEPLAVPQEPPFTTSRAVAMDSDLPRQRIVSVWLGPALGERDRVGLTLLARLLGQQKAADGSPVDASMGERVDADLFQLAATGPGAAATLEKMEQRAREELFSAEDVAKARALTLKELADAPLRARPYFALAATFAIQEALGHATDLAQEDETLSSFTATELRELARKWLDPARKVTVTFHASSEEIAALPDDPGELEAAADAAAEAGDLNRAIAAYSKLLDMGPDRMHIVIYLYSRADVHKQQGDFQAGIDDCEAALKVVDYPAVRALLEELQGLEAERKAGAGGED